MKKNTKKKVLTLALVLALLAIAVVGGSLAWFTDSDEATNTFTVGSVEIVQHEKQWNNERTEQVAFEQDKMLLPVVGNDPTVATDNFLEKFVTVENVGKNAAYVQTFIAVPADLDNAGVLKLWDLNAENNGWTKTLFAKPGPTIDDVVYNVYRYRHNEALAAGETSKRCLSYVYIDSKTDLNAYDTNNNGETDTGYFVMNGKEITSINAFEKLNVYVLTQACQVEGFADADTALNSAFPENIMPDFTNVDAD